MKLEVEISNTGELVTLEEESLLETLRKKGVKIRSSCGGHATCSDCIVKVISGGKSLSEVNFEEKKLLGNVYYITKERLSCQVKVNREKDVDASLEGVKVEIINLDD